MLNIKNIAIVIGVIALSLSGFIVYRNATTPDTSQRAREMTNIHYDFHPSFGCMRIPEQQYMINK